MTEWTDAAASVSSNAQPATGMSLLSVHFLIFAIAAVIVFRLVTAGRLRAGAVSLFNTYFFLQFYAGWVSLAVLGALVLITWILGKARLRLGERVPVWAIVAIIAAFWVFLFLARDPALGGSLNPFRSWSLRIIGLSYMVFRCISYVMDIEILEDTSLGTLVNYLLFFPTLLAGPIETHERFQQFQRGEDLELQSSPMDGFHRIVNGYLKKFVVADNLSVFTVFAMPAGEIWPGPFLWIGVLLLPVILYLDMSGYCDIMIGLTRLMGFRLAENFDSPWRAVNVQEFWTRWHITLSEFVRMYVFTPLAHAIAAHFHRRWQWILTLIASFFAMMLIALWHGLSWSFLVFGLIHGSALIILQVYRLIVRLSPTWSTRLQKSPAMRWMSWSMTYMTIAASITVWGRGPTDAWRIMVHLLGGAS